MTQLRQLAASQARNIAAARVEALCEQLEEAIEGVPTMQLVQQHQLPVVLAHLGRWLAAQALDAAEASGRSAQQEQAAVACGQALQAAAKLLREAEWPDDDNEALHGLYRAQAEAITVQLASAQLLPVLAAAMQRTAAAVLSDSLQS